MSRLRHILIRLLLVLVPVGMAVAQARGQADTVCAGGISTWAVEEVPGDSYIWELYNDVTGINFATDPGNCPASEAYFEGGINTGDSVNVMCVEPGTYFIKVTATNECPTNNLKVGKIVVVPCLSYAVFLPPDEICQGDTAWMTIEVTGAPGPWEVVYTNGIDSWTITVPTTPYTFALDPAPALPGDYPYWITSVTNVYGLTNNDPSDEVLLIVKPKPVTSPIYRY